MRTLTLETETLRIMPTGTRVTDGWRLITALSHCWVVEPAHPANTEAPRLFTEVEKLFAHYHFGEPLPEGTAKQLFWVEL